MAVNLIESAPRGPQVALRLRVTGVAPLLMRSDTLLDATHPLVSEIREITDKPSKKRTPADLAQMARLEWQGGLYYDDDLGPFLPSVNVKMAIRGAAGLARRGASIKRGVQFTDIKLPLLYDGPRDPDGLYAAGFRDTRGVRNGGMGGSVMRTRPCFEEWALEATMYVDPHEISIEDVAGFVAAAQRFGLGDYRPEFGLFTAELYVLEDSER